MKLNDIYLPCCIPNRSLHHSIQADQLVLWSLDSRASPVSLGYQVDQVGPGYLSVLHLANLKIKESVLVKKTTKTPKIQVFVWHLVKRFSADDAGCEGIKGKPHN